MSARGELFQPSRKRGAGVRGEQCSPASPVRGACRCSRKSNVPPMATAGSREAASSRLPRGSLSGPACLLGYGEDPHMVAEESQPCQVRPHGEERHDVGSESHDCGPGFLSKNSLQVCEERRKVRLFPVPCTGIEKVCVHRAPRILRRWPRLPALPNSTNVYPP
jgi:hypothetical protein